MTVLKQDKMAYGKSNQMIEKTSSHAHLGETPDSYSKEKKIKSLADGCKSLKSVLPQRAWGPGRKPTNLI